MGRWALVCLAALSARCASVVTADVRGVPAADWPRFESQTSFACTSGVVISASRVNDNYCDCADGSDEPGTPACSNGVFFCNNAGHVPRDLSSSFVDDGICDCCDGSDEPAGCPNTCAALGTAASAAKQQLMAHYRQGARNREHLLASAANRKRDWTARLAQLQAEIASLEPAVATLLEEKQAADARKRTLQADSPEDAAAIEGAAAEVQAALKGEHPEDTGDDYDEYAADAPDAAPTENSDGLPEGFERPPAAEEEDSLVNTADSGGETGEEDAEAVGRRIAAQWTQDPDAAAAAGAAGAGEVAPAAATVAGNSGECSAGGGSESGTCAAAPGAESADAKATVGAPAGGSGAGFVGGVRNAVRNIFRGSAPEPEGAEGDLNRAIKEAASASERWVTESAKLRAVEKERTALSAKLGRDYGPDDVFAYMDGECYERKIEKYTYKVCGFGRAFQVDGSQTSLGTFSGYAQGYTVLTFDKGAQCWQGPPRSMTVSLECGPETALQEVTEPSRCQYAAVLSSPVVCVPAVLDALQREIDDLSANAQS